MSQRFADLGILPSAGRRRSPPTCGSEDSLPLPHSVEQPWADPSRRRLLRHGLRNLIRKHPLGQPDRFVRAFYAKAEEVARA